MLKNTFGYHIMILLSTRKPILASGIGPFRVACVSLCTEVGMQPTPSFSYSSHSRVSPWNKMNMSLRRYSTLPLLRTIYNHPSACTRCWCAECRFTYFDTATCYNRHGAGICNVPCAGHPAASCGGSMTFNLHRPVATVSDYKPS